MTVKELIEKLKACDPDSIVVVNKTYEDIIQQEEAEEVNEENKHVFIG